jgi:hypothetical protein
MIRTACFATLLAVSLLATPAHAATYTSVQDAAGVPAYVDELSKMGFSVLSIVPAVTSSRQVCVPCLTQDGHTVCADPDAPPEAPFCHTESELVSVLVVYRDGQPCAAAR